MNFLGVDLAWTPSGGTGLCLIRDGRALESTRVSTDDEILAWLEPRAADGAVVAIDAPLIVRNATGRRSCDQLISQCFGAQHASTHSANLSLDSFRNGVRGERIAAALGLDVDPHFAPGSPIRRAVEVYPHPAIVALFELPVTLKYKAKPGRTLESRSAEMSALVAHLEGLAHADPPADVRAAPRWDLLAGTTEAPASGAALSRAEDEIDAFVCAYIALYYWTHGTARCRVAGDASDGYILTPVTPAQGACLDRLTSALVASRPVPTTTLLPTPVAAGAVADNTRRIQALLPDAVTAAATPHLFELRVGGDEGLIVLVTAEAVELRLPTLEWTAGSHDPVQASRIWKRIDIRSAGDDALANEVAAARRARESEFAICRYCGQRLPIEHRVSSDLCHGCASEREGVVF